MGYNLLSTILLATCLVIRRVLIVRADAPRLRLCDLPTGHTGILSRRSPGTGWNRALDSQDAGFRQILSDLWYKIVLPIICAAMEHQPSLVNCDEGENRAHVRWCPTGQLAFLPFHAAGDYSLSGKGHRVFDFVVSSYIPTLNSIIRSTPPTSSEDTTMDSTIKVLAVACPYAKGQVPIPDTEDEVTRVGRHVVPLLDQPATPVSQYTALVKKTATAERVLEEMKEATWVHLACHGVQDATSPTSSALLLSDGTRLSLSDIAAEHLPRAEFAFLSACQTATGYDKIPSESLHLAAGMLLAGYCSVIGTMWSIADRHAPQVADDVYGFLLREGTGRRPDHKESALALHLAMQKLRARIGEGSFLAWVPYIHIGA
ncbi:hypothetical protein BDZ89DRAFT_993544 [Hymenopellis radicata]|nr:hypothetical protein BDZ89DRAFT_993544 [Hymenopellis radicata]